MIDITNDTTVNNPFVEDYERRMREYKEQLEDYQRKLKASEEEKQIHGIKVALGTAAGAALIFSVANAAKDKKYKKAVNQAWDRGYNTGCALTEMSAQSYINGMNDGIKALPGNKA